MSDSPLFGLIHLGYAPIVWRDRQVCRLPLTLIAPEGVNRAVLSALVSARLVEA
ncbi:MAG: hypothetical protein WCT47_08480 [Betaproteobacteria bacterium]|jgi:hypothetical protein